MAQATTLMTAVLFAMMAFSVKILSISVPVAEILFIRALISVILISSVLIVVYKNRIKVRNGNMLLVRGSFGGFAVLMYFMAISRIPLSSAALLANAYPLFAVLFSAILIKEKPHFDSLVALLIAFSGMFLVLDPHFGKIDIGYLMALAAAVFGGVAVTSIRELRKTDSSWIISLSQMIGAGLLSLMLLPAGFVRPNPVQWAWLAFIGIMGTGAQLFFSRPFKFIPTAEGSMVAPLYTVFAIVLSVVFLNEVITLRFIFGALLVFGSIIYLMAREEIKLRKNVL